VTATGALDVYGIGGNNGVYHRQQATPGGAYDWWVDLGGNVKQIAVATNPDGRMEVFAVSSDDRVLHLWQSTPGTYAAWANLAGSARQIALGTNADGSLDLFAVGTDGAVYDDQQASPGSVLYDGWVPLGGVVV
jgi:hypothetical protein